MRKTGRMGPEARAVAARSGRSVSRRVASSSISSSGALVNPSAGAAITRAARELGPETRGQRAANSIFRAIGTGISGGFF